MLTAGPRRQASVAIRFRWNNQTVQGLEIDSEKSVMDCTWNGISCATIRQKITSFPYDSLVAALDADLKLMLSCGAFLFSSSRSSATQQHCVRLTHETTTFIRYSYLNHSDSKMEVVLLDADSLWEISFPVTALRKTLVLPVMNSEIIHEIEYYLREAMSQKIRFEFNIVTKDSNPLHHISVSELYDRLRVPGTPGLRFAVLTDTPTWVVCYTPQNSMIQQPQIQSSEMIQCTNELKYLCTLENFRGFSDTAPSAFIDKANKVGSQIETAMDLFEKVTSYSGNAVDTLKEFKFDFGAVVNGLETIANIGSMVPFVSSACKVITTVIDFAKKVEQNERNIVYLKQHGTLLQHAIDTRVKAYFSIDSVWVIDNEVCLSNYCNILIESAKVLIEIVETICQYDKRSLFGKFLGEAFKMKNAAIDLTDPQMRLDYSIKSILVLDPIHLAFNLNSIATMFHSPEAFDFWRANRFCHSAEAERLVYGLIKIASARNGLKDTALFEMKLLDELHARANGYIRAEDFGGWYSEIKFQAFLQRITTQSHQPNAIEAQIDDGFVAYLDPTFFDGEVQSLLNDCVPDTRDWLLRRVESKKSKGYILQATAGFGKSMVSALAVNQWNCLYYFFKVDDRNRRTAENMVKTLLYQLYQKIMASNSDEANSLKTKILHNLENTKKLEDIIIEHSHLFDWLVIDALDECPSRDSNSTTRFLERLVSAKSGCKVLATSRPPETVNSSTVLAGVQMGKRIDSGFQDSSNFEILCDLESDPQTNNDLRIYLESTLREITDRGIEVLLSKAQGCFLWAKLAVSIIRDLNEESHIPYIARTVLQRDLSQLYLTSFNNSLKMSTMYQKGINSILSLVIVAEDLFKVAELEYAWIADWIRRDGEKKIAYSVMSESDLDIQWLEGSKSFSKYFVYALSRLMLRSDYDGYVKVGHKSLRDIVEKNQLVQYVDIHAGHLTMAHLCLELLDGLSAERIGYKPSGVKERAQHSLILYACRFWYFHVEKVQANNSAEFEVLLDKIRSVFTSPNAIHWIGLLAAEKKLNCAYEGFSYLLSFNDPVKDSNLRNITDGLRKMVARFSDILLECPREIYTSAAIFGANKNNLAHKLFEQVVPSDYRPRICLGAQSFWSGEFTAITTKIRKPIVSFIDNDQILISNHYFQVRDANDCEFEVWDLQTSKKVRKLIRPYSTRYILTKSESGMIQFEQNGVIESIGVVAAIYDRCAALDLWLGSEHHVLELASVPVDMQTLFLQEFNLIFILLKDALACVTFATPENPRMKYFELGQYIGKPSILSCQVTQGSIWLGVEFVSKNGSTFTLMTSPLCDINSLSFSTIETPWNSKEFSIGYYISPLKESALSVVRLTDDSISFWEVETDQVVSVDYQTCVKEYKPTIAQHDQIVAVASENGLVVLNFRTKTPETRTLAYSDVQWQKNFVYFVQIDDNLYFLHAYGTETEIYEKLVVYDLSSCKSVPVRDREFSSISINDSKVLICDLYHRAVCINLPEIIFSFTETASMLLNTINEPMYVSEMQVTNSGKLFLMYGPDATFEVLDLSQVDNSLVVKFPNAAVFEEGRRDNCNIFVGSDGMTMLISSLKYGKLLWYDVSEAASPRLAYDVKGWIEKGWAQTCFDGELHHIVYAPAGDRHENRLHVAFNNLESALKAEEVIPSVVEMTQKPDNDIGDFEETIGFGHDYDVHYTVSTPKGSRVLEESNDFYTGSIFDINGSGWFVGSSRRELKVWCLETTEPATDVLFLSEANKFSKVIPKQATTFSITDISSAVVNSYGVVAIGFSHGLVAMMLIHEGRFLLESLVTMSFNSSVTEVNISIQDYTLVVVERGAENTASLSLYGWKLIDEIIVFHDRQLRFEDTILKWSRVESGNVPSALVILTGSGKLLRTVIREQGTELVCELHIPALFVQDKCHTLKTYGNKVALLYQRMFLLVDLGSSLRA